MQDAGADVVLAPDACLVDDGAAAGADDQVVARRGEAEVTGQLGVGVGRLG